MLNIIKNTINRVFASGVDSDASAFITATGLSGTTQKSAITTLVKDLKSSGLWSKMKAVYPMVTDQRNIFSYTEDFTNAAWNKFNISISLNSVTAPNGALTGSTLTDNTTNGFHYIGTAATAFGQNGNNTFSIYAKANTLNWIVLYIFDGTTSNPTYFNLSNGTVGTNTAGNIASIVDAGNGWYRCSVTRNYNGTALNSNCGFILANADGVNSYAGTGKSLYVWGSQFEYGASATTYQPILTTPSAFIASQMKYNLKDARDLDAAFRLTWSGGWTYSATGATPNGTNAYADTKLNDSILTPNSSHLSFYSRTNINQPTYDIGLFNSINGIWLGVGNNNRIKAGIFQTGASGELDQAVTNTLGFVVATKNGSTTSTAYKNGVNLISGVKPDTSATNTTVYLGALNQNGVPAYGFSTKQIGFATIGNGLSDQDNMLFNQIVEKYQVALSRGVQAAQSFYYNSAYSNEANTYLYSTQITGTTQVSAINTLINGLKANNLWTKMKAVYPFVTDYRNILGYTEDFGDASWTKGNSTITINSTTSPTGTLTADSLVENTLNTTHLVSNTTGITTSADNYTLSVYAKKANRDWVYLNLYNGTTSLFAWFNLNTGAVGTVQSGLTAAIQDAGSGWYRLSVTRTLPSTSNCFIQYGSASADNTTTFVGNGLVAAYLWGAQFELGTSASAYQPVLAVNNYATNVAAQMKFNLVNPQDSDAAFRLAFSGGWTYSTNGAQPNGTNGYIDTKLIGNTHVIKGDFGYGIYSRTNSNTTGAYGVDASLHIYPRFTDSNSYYRIFFNNTAGINNGNSLGLIYGFNDATNTSYSWFNGVKRQTFASPGVINSVNLMLAGNVLSTGGYDNRQLSFAFASQYLNDTEAALLYQLVQQFQTDLSRQV